MRRSGRIAAAVVALLAGVLVGGPAGAQAGPAPVADAVDGAGRRSGGGGHRQRLRPVRQPGGVPVPGRERPAQRLPTCRTPRSPRPTRPAPPWSASCWTAPSHPFGETSPVDCSGQGCVLGAAVLDGFSISDPVVVPTTFAPSPSLATAVEPADDLVEGQVVRVTAGGFPAGSAAVIAECSVFPERLSNCDQATAVDVVVDAAGEIDVDYTVTDRVSALSARAVRRPRASWRSARWPTPSSARCASPSDPR